MLTLYKYEGKTEEEALTNCLEDLNVEISFPPKSLCDTTFKARSTRDKDKKEPRNAVNNCWHETWWSQGGSLAGTSDFPHRAGMRTIPRFGPLLTLVRPAQASYPRASQGIRTAGAGLCSRRGHIVAPRIHTAFFQTLQ